MGQVQTNLLAHSYKFGCRLLNQNEVAECIMTPTVQSRQKRLAFGCVPDAWVAREQSALLPCAASERILKQVHDYSSSAVLPHRVTTVLDGYALEAYDAIAAGVSEFLESQKGRACNRAFKVKLMFYRSDLLRQPRALPRRARLKGRFGV